MDRQIVYPGAIPLETDLLNTNKNAMIGLSKLAAAILGTSTMLNGLAVTPTGPASLQVYVAPGEIYSLQNIDGTAYSSLAADTTHAILKQGIMLDQATLSCPAPVTAGQSINYLIQVAYQDTDASAVVLPYYNSSNPSQAYAGPANAGTAQNTVRKGVCTVSAKAGVAATTGSQTTPAPDAGYVGAFVVTVANGQTQITAPNISTYAGAPFLPSGGLIIGGLQGNACNISAAGGTADAITGSYTPGITALTNGMTLYVRAGSANATTAPTFTPNSGTIAAKTIVKGAGSALVAGDVAGAGHWLELQYDATLDKWVLQNPAKGVVIQPQILPLSASVSGNILTVTLNATTLDFRTAVASSGTINSRAVTSPISVAVPANATLGCPNGIQQRLAVVALDNAGVVELGVCNVAGAGSFDESLPATTFALGAGSTSGGIIYSTNARASLPYRLVGFIDIVYAGGTGWATTPVLVQGAGGNSVASFGSLGHGQAWQGVSGSRTLGTTYYNTTGRPICVQVSATSTTSANILGAIGGSTVAAQGAGGGISMGVSFIVPPGVGYSVSVSAGTPTLGAWNELR